MTSNIFQVDTPSFSIDNFKTQCALVFQLTSIQEATKKRHYSEAVAQPLILDLNFTFSQAHVTELLVLRKGKSSATLDQLGVVK